MSEKTPTDRQKLWLRYYLDENSKDTFLNKTASARAAGYADHPASGQQVWKYWAEELEQWMDEEGFSNFRLKSKLLELMEAKESKFFQKDGKVTDTKEVEALGIQAKATELALKVKGLFAPEKRELTGAGGGPIRYNAEPMNQKALKDAIDGASD